MQELDRYFVDISKFARYGSLAFQCKISIRSFRHCFVRKWQKRLIKNRKSLLQTKLIVYLIKNRPLNSKTFTAYLKCTLNMKTADIFVNKLKHDHFTNGSG